jgi:hypothetical protein
MESPVEQRPPPPVGTWIHVLPGHGSENLLGRLVQHWQDSVVLDMEEPYFLNSGARLLLFCGEVGRRVAAEAIAIDPYAPDGATFQLLSSWWPADTRSSERYQVRLRTGVRPPGAGKAKEVLGVTLNVSLGGIAVEVLDPIEEREVEIMIGVEADVFAIPCDVVGTHQNRDSVVLRLQFKDLSPVQARLVERMVDIARQRSRPPAA